MSHSARVVAHRMAHPAVVAALRDAEKKAGGRVELPEAIQGQLGPVLAESAVEQRINVTIRDRSSRKEVLWTTSDVLEEPGPVEASRPETSARLRTGLADLYQNMRRIRRAEIWVQLTAPLAHSDVVTFFWLSEANPEMPISVVPVREIVGADWPGVGPLTGASHPRALVESLRWVRRLLATFPHEARVVLYHRP